MRAEAVHLLVRHQIRDRFPISTNHDRLIVRFQLGKETGKICFGFVNVYSFHKTMLVYLVRFWQSNY